MADHDSTSDIDVGVARMLRSIELPSPTAAQSAALVATLERELARRQVRRPTVLVQLAVARAQLVIFPLGFWFVSTLVLAVGVGLIALGLDPSRSLIAYLIGPVLAYVGMESAFSASGARVLDLELATPIGPRQLALARLVVMLGYQIAVGAALTLSLWLVDGGALFSLLATWLMPLFLASGLTLILSARLPIHRAATVVYAIWTLVVLAGWRLHGPDISVGVPLELALAAAGLILIVTWLALFAPATLRNAPRTFGAASPYPQS